MIKNMLADDVIKAYKLSREYPAVFYVKMFPMLGSRYEKLRPQEAKSRIMILCMN